MREHKTTHVRGERNPRYSACARVRSHERSSLPESLLSPLSRTPVDLRKAPWKIGHFLLSSSAFEGTTKVRARAQSYRMIQYHDDTPRLRSKPALIAITRECPKVPGDEPSSLKLIENARTPQPAAHYPPRDIPKNASQSTLCREAAKRHC